MVSQFDEVESYLKEKLKKMLLIDEYRTIFNEALSLRKKTKKNCSAN
jgi:hypothetical protein